MVTHEPRRRDDRLRSMAREGFTLMVGAATWAFEQSERLMDAWMEQGRASRTEGRRRFDAMTASTRDGIRNWTAGMPVATRDQVLSLERRIEELTRQVEALRASNPEAGAGQGFEEARPSSIT